MEERRFTLRRTLEQAIHCLIEAQSIIANEEDARLADEDVRQAKDLISNSIQPRIQKILERQAKQPTY